MPRSPISRLVVLFAALLWTPAALAAVLVGDVVGIVDGDTLDVLTADKAQHRIRLHAIDAPERSQAYSQVSKQSLSDMVYGQRVTAECGKNDRFERPVCKVLIDGRDVGLAQIQRGLAWHFKRYEREQSAADRAAYAKAEEEARAARRGLWRDPEPVAPWVFRSAKQQSSACALVLVVHLAAPPTAPCP